MHCIAQGPRGTRGPWRESALSRYFQQGAVPPHICEPVTKLLVLGHPAFNPPWHSLQAASSPSGVLQVLSCASQSLSWHFSRALH